LWYSAEYSTFSISDEVGKYQLTVDGYSGEAGDALMTASMSDWIANGMMFSTPDSDNDIWDTNSCGVTNKCGWWFGKCGTSVINREGGLGRWKTVGATADVQASRMLVKLI